MAATRKSTQKFEIYNALAGVVVLTAVSRTEAIKIARVGNQNQ